MSCSRRNQNCAPHAPQMISHRCSCCCSCCSCTNSPFFQITPYPIAVSCAYLDEKNLLFPLFYLSPRSALTREKTRRILVFPSSSCTTTIREQPPSFSQWALRSLLLSSIVARVQQLDQSRSSKHFCFFLLLFFSSIALSISFFARYSLFFLLWPILGSSFLLSFLSTSRSD